MKLPNQTLKSMALSLTAPCLLVAGEEPRSEVDEKLPTDHPDHEMIIGAEFEENTLDDGGEIERRTYSFRAKKMVDQFDFIDAEDHNLSIGLGYRFDQIDLAGIDGLDGGSHDIHGVDLNLQATLPISERWAFLAELNLDVAGTSDVGALAADGGLLAVRSLRSSKSQLLLGAEYSQELDTLFPVIGYGWRSERAQFRVSTYASYFELSATERLSLHLRASPGGARWHFRDEIDGRSQDIDLRHLAIRSELAASYRFSDSLSIELGAAGQFANKYEGEADGGRFLDSDADDVIFGFARFKLAF